MPVWGPIRKPILWSIKHWASLLGPCSIFLTRYFKSRILWLWSHRHAEQVKQGPLFFLVCPWQWVNWLCFMGRFFGAQKMNSGATFDRFHAVGTTVQFSAIYIGGSTSVRSSLPQSSSSSVALGAARRLLGAAFWGKSASASNNSLRVAPIAGNNREQRIWQMNNIKLNQTLESGECDSHWLSLEGLQIYISFIIILNVAVTGRKKNPWTSNIKQKNYSHWQSPSCHGRSGRICRCWWHFILIEMSTWTSKAHTTCTFVMRWIINGRHGAHRPSTLSILGLLKSLQFPQVCSIMVVLLLHLLANGDEVPNALNVIGMRLVDILIQLQCGGVGSHASIAGGNH